MNRLKTSLRLIKLGLCVYFILLFLVTAFALLRPLFPDPSLEDGALVIVLSGGQTSAGKMGLETKGRTDAALKAAENYKNIQFLMSGGRPHGRLQSSGQLMADYAISKGRASDLVYIEGASRSTLQNALFTKEAWKSHTSFVVVTDEFHLPRSWLSFKAMGAAKVSMLPSRVHNEWDWSLRKSQAEGILMEPLKIGLNFLRFCFWKGGQTLGYDQAAMDSLLR